MPTSQFKMSYLAPVAGVSSSFVPAGLNAQSNAAGGGTAAPVTYSLTPWNNATNWSVYLPLSSSPNTTAQNANNQWSTNYPLTNRTTNFKIQAVLSANNAILGLTNTTPTPTGDIPATGYCFYTNASLGKYYARSASVNLALYNVTGSAKTSSITYDGATISWYMDDTLIASKSAVNTPHTQVYVGGFIPAFYEILYTDLTGSSTTYSMTPWQNDASWQHWLPRVASPNGNAIQTTSGLWGINGPTWDCAYPATYNRPTNFKVDCCIGAFGVMGLLNTTPTTIGDVPTTGYCWHRTNDGILYARSASVNIASYTNPGNYNIQTSLAYDGNLMYWYLTGSLIASKSAVNTPFTRVYFEYYNAEFRNIQYGDYTGSSTPPLPPVFINFK